ncbi:MAG: hypothetical protein J5766_04340 [Clostridia bacterium]|nr:hypothetical protein [Clostridia bacterium]
MTGFDIFESAILRLGLVNVKGSLEQQLPFRKTALSIINELAFDLCKAGPIASLHDKLDIDREAGVVISYGTAYVLATITGETEKQMTMLALFNAKRKLYLGKIGRITDKSPNISGG